MTLKTGLGSLICINEPKLKETGTKIKIRLQNQIFSIFLSDRQKRGMMTGKRKIQGCKDTFVWFARSSWTLKKLNEKKRQVFNGLCRKPVVWIEN